MRGQANDPEPGRTQRRFLLLASAVALGALVGVVMIVLSLIDEDPPHTNEASSSISPGKDTGVRARESQRDPISGLPVGASSHDGHPVGFPRTEAGAASMVVELSRAQIGLDYEAALKTIRVYSAPEDHAFFDELATSAITQRRTDLGVPVEADGGGEVNAPIGYAETPVGYQIEAYGEDLYLVSVLSEVTATTANGQVSRSTYVGQQLVTWTRNISANASSGRDGGGDWRLVEPTPTEREELFASPIPVAAPLGTSQFKRAGWIPLVDPSPDGYGQ